MYQPFYNYRSYACIEKNYKLHLKLLDNPQKYFITCKLLPLKKTSPFNENY
ncbi:MAG: hypothetical protein JWQ54_3465 [Mucilaginibacter sp.]|nr:hypothetical protein [Mucilaginibacter sp.]